MLSLVWNFRKLCRNYKGTWLRLMKELATLHHTVLHQPRPKNARGSRVQLPVKKSVICLKRGQLLLKFDANARNWEWWHHSILIEGCIFTINNRRLWCSWTRSGRERKLRLGRPRFPALFGNDQREDRVSRRDYSEYAFMGVNIPQIC